ncbi:MAG TPA: CU044_5270 family protein, partial [Pilimelia sp.]|nr:CU044_5270 family protein [Pilimelia sp.]
AAAPELTARPDQFVFVESVENRLILRADDRGSGAKRRVIAELTGRIRLQRWLSADGTRDGLVRGDPTLPGRRDRSFPEPGCRDGRQALGPDAPGESVACTPQPAYRSDLPTTTEGMRRYLYRPIGETPSMTGPMPEFAADVPADLRAMVRVAEVVRAAPLSPAVQAAAFRVAATIPGVTVVRRATDATGRTGIAVRLAWADSRTDLIFDAETYAYLGTNSVLTTDLNGLKGIETRGLAAGRPSLEEAVLRAAVVDRPGQLP